MRPESERIENLNAGSRLLVFSFWTGKLPEISRLHFLTAAKSLPSESRYVLLVQDAEISDPIHALLDRCGIDVVPLDVAQLLEESGVGRFLRRTPLSWAWPFVKYFRWAAVPAGLGYRRSKRSLMPRYNRLLGGPPLTATTISDFVRVVVSSIVKTRTLYTDIDFAFVRPLEWIFHHESFVYRWERQPYANNALISVAATSPIKRGALLELLVRAGSADPRILFSDENCRTSGLEVLPCDRLDPLWSPANPGLARSRDFFRCRRDSEGVLHRLRTQFDAVHWHNRWRMVPETGSPYDLWLREFA